MQKRKAGQDCALDHDRVGCRKEQTERRRAALAHLQQRPGRGHAAFGRRVHQDFPDDALTKQIVCLSREEPRLSVQIVTGRKSLARDQRHALDDSPDPLRAAQDKVWRPLSALCRGYHGIWPLTAASTQTSVGRKTGL